MNKLLKWIRKYNLDIGTNIHFRVGNNGKENCYVTTDNYEYCIVVNDKKPKGYIGCIASCRKTRIGETHLRGKDLPDGPYIIDTFISILAGIVRSECQSKQPLIKEQPIVEDKEA